MNELLVLVIACVSLFLREKSKKNEKQERPFQNVNSHNEELPTNRILNMTELLYPDELVAFQKLNGDGHKDIRGLVYTILRFNTEQERPFSDDEISYLDFGKKSTAYSILKKNNLICPLEQVEEIEALFTRDELVEQAQKMGLPTTGKKQAIAERLVNNGYRIDRRKHRKKLFHLTKHGIEVITEYRTDEQSAIAHAITALKNLDYKLAVASYRNFDRKWGFVHTSGKKHTIFAHYDIPYSRFRVIETCGMWELNNTSEFKLTLRACVLAGFMRGVQDYGRLAYDFTGVCSEKINCPSLLSLFDYDSEVLQNMQRQIEYSDYSALGYYISHLLYLSRHEAEAID